MSIKNITTGLFLIFGVMTSIGQIHHQQQFTDRVKIGGSLGLSFGNGFFSGTLAPSAIYQFTPQFAMGVGLNGTYNSLKNNYESTILGGSALALYNVIPEIQLSAEFEELNVNRKYKETFGEDFTENYWYPALFLGVGFHANNIAIGIRYDVLYENDKSIYADAFVPFVRVYF